MGTERVVSAMPQVGCPMKPASVDSGEQFANDPAVDVGQAHVAAAVEIGQERMVEAQQVQDRGVQVVDVDLDVDGSVAELVGHPVSMAPSDAPAGQPGGETARA